MKISTYTTIGFIVVFVALFVIFKPVITGSVVGLEEEKQEFEDAISILNASLASCDEQNEECSINVEKANADLQISEKKFQDLRVECANEKKEIREILEDVEEECEDYEDVIENAAHSICCKQKIDNMNINYYEIEDNKIKCLEEGDNELNCW